MVVLAAVSAAAGSFRLECVVLLLSLALALSLALNFATSSQESADLPHAAAVREAVDWNTSAGGGRLDDKLCCSDDTSGGGGDIVLQGHVCQQRRRGLKAVVWKKLWMVVTSTDVSVYKHADMKTRHYRFLRGAVRAELRGPGLVLLPAGAETVHLRAAADGPASGEWCVALGSAAKL